jgi:hypothetical protein
VEKFPKCGKLKSPSLMNLNNVKMAEERAVKQERFVDDSYPKTISQCLFYE